ncbi:MAG: AAA family ATPase [Microcoleus sp. PH2017_10_PVI_O_A]|uniref:AAA family ATPase n=1 Tax=unclassified Microcoleus TaxID=2642155 RepID=UPI001DC7047E|nr:MULTISPECIES: AAA family ATPase [unclassified Microcoleus]TAE81216.1 MAG: excinuclease [Oscillatoriales cyanobacterium]MCC3407211.1 AAA family ATPase [Microcoleus sp. PH2017_10_PVI_O_A]MCC3461303.1 AAA family ATPase [Microcoleus sp. PH2017_11_PCY_U_A]MCC3479759.1 AAA family ATPase [Microcoleus sp. PH2017_12_PCY_D_A]MCC3531733.1 AAA family ATPase [Microcoleus sp. PH2017_21_RUC_O_A]
MRINKISVTKLFGVFNHPVSLNMEDRIAIIHSPNGFGKTALFRLINGFFNSLDSELWTIPFTEFRLDFDDGSCLQITKSIDAPEHEKDKNLMFYFAKPGAAKEIFSPNLIMDSIDDFSAGINVSSDITDDTLQSSGDIDTPTQVSELELERILVFKARQLISRLAKSVKKEPKWLSELRSSIDVHFIETQRLLTPSSFPKPAVDTKHPSMIPSVSIYSQELAEEIQAKLAEYGALSQSLERTFPARIFNNKSPSNITEKTLHNKLNEIEQKRSLLREIGLLDKDENPDFQIEQHIDNTTKNILSVYVEDVEQKLMVFKELATKIELFTRIIQQRFLYKHMSISKDKGFTFTTADGKPLLATDLSFGEQHELVMLYELLFRVKPNSLVLIDEPEISLHIAWQVEFLKDLQAIIKLANFDVLIASHSPDIIDDRWDLTVELKGPVE